MLPWFSYIYTLLKQKYEMHTKIDMFREFTPRIPILVTKVCITYMPSYKYAIKNVIYSF